MNLKRLRQVFRRLWFFHINLKYKLNLDMDEKGIIARDCCPGLPTEPVGARSGGASAASCLSSLLHVADSMGTWAVVAPAAYIYIYI